MGTEKSNAGKSGIGTKDVFKPVLIGLVESDSVLFLSLVRFILGDLNTATVLGCRPKQPHETLYRRSGLSSNTNESWNG